MPTVTLHPYSGGPQESLAGTGRESAPHQEQGPGDGGRVLGLIYGFDDSTRRTVSENARSLSAQSSEFEQWCQVAALVA